MKQVMLIKTMFDLVTMCPCLLAIERRVTVNFCFSQGPRNAEFFFSFPFSSLLLPCVLHHPQLSPTHSGLFSALKPKKWAAGANEKWADSSCPFPSRQLGGPARSPRWARSLDTSFGQLLLRASHQRLLGGMAGQISLMSEAPVLIGALCSAVLSRAFIFNAGKGWIFFLSHSHAFLPWLMAPHSERPLH